MPAGAHTLGNVTPPCDAFRACARTSNAQPHHSTRSTRLITRAQALAAGLTDGQITRLLRNGTWFEIRPIGVCDRGRAAVVGADPARERLAFGCRAWASHGTAGHLCGAARASTNPSSSRSCRRSSHARPTRRGAGSAVTERCSTVDRHDAPPHPDGHRRTRADRRLVAAHRPSGSAVVLDDAIRRRLIELEEFRRCAGRLLPAPGRSMSKVHDGARRRIPGYDPGDSDLETRALRALIAAGLPAAASSSTASRLRRQEGAHRPRLSGAEDRDRARLVGVPRQGQPHGLHGRPSEEERSAS